MNKGLLKNESLDSPPSKSNALNKELNNLEDIPLDESKIMKNSKENEKSSSPSLSKSSLLMSARVDTDDIEEKIAKLRALPKLPVFEDHKLARISINYWLYLEVFYIMIRILVKTFFFTLILTIILMYAEIAEGAKSIIRFVLIGLFLVGNRFLEQRRLLSEKALYEFQWTENLFCVLIENIPVKTKREELKDFFNSLLPIRLIGGYVKDIILVKDYFRQSQLKEFISVIDKKLEDPKFKDELKPMLRTKKADLETQLEAEKVLTSEGDHSGKAIITFNNLLTRNVVLTHLRPSILRSLRNIFVKAWRGFSLQAHYIYARDLPEPQDLIYENICYPKMKKLFRAFLAYGGGLAVLMIFGTLMVLLTTEKKETAANKSTLSSSSYTFKSYAITILLIVSGTLMEKIFRFLNNYYVDLSKSETKMNYLNYLIFNSIVLYLAVQTINIIYSQVGWESLVIKAIVIYCIKKTGMKGFYAFMNDPSSEKIISKRPDGKLKDSLIKVRKAVQVKGTEFDFVSGVGGVIPILSMSYAFMSLAPLVIIPVVVIALFGSSFFDKARIILKCEPLTLNSAQYMLKAFKIFQWDHFCVLFGGIISNLILSDGKSDTDELIQTLKLVSMILGGFYGFFFFFYGVPSSLDAHFEDKFVKSNCTVNYDRVVSEFTSRYSKASFDGKGFEMEMKRAESLML